MAQVAKELGVKYNNNGSLVIGFNDEGKKTIEELYKREVENGGKRNDLYSMPDGLPA